MSIIATSTGSPKQFKLAPAGNHIARVSRIIHIGTVPEVYNGEDKMMNKVLIGFELPTELEVFKEEKGKEPFVVSREYTLSMNEKANLRKLVEGILGVALSDEEAEHFDVTSLSGKVCLLNVVHKTSQVSKNEYAIIQGAAPLPKGMTAPDAVNKPLVVDYDTLMPDDFNNLPDYIKEKMKVSVEYKKWQITPTF